MFIDAKSDISLLNVAKKALKLLPAKFTIATTIQHLEKSKEAVKFFEKNNKKITKVVQVLGCTVPKIGKNEDVLYIGSGNFHPVGISIKTGNEVIVANPFTNEIKKITKQDLQNYEKKKKVNFVKFLSAKNIGIIVTIKRQRFGNIDKIKKKYPDKTYYIFACDEVDLSKLENFPFIDCWINTACPRMFDDSQLKKGFVNIEDL